MNHQKTRIQVTNQHGNTDVTIVSQGSGDIQVDINDTTQQLPPQAPPQKLEQFFQALAQKRMQQMKTEFQETQAFMQKMQELAQSLEGQNQRMAQAMQKQVQELEDKPEHEDELIALEP